MTGEVSVAKKREDRARDEQGFALVITLVITALLVALMVEFVNETYVGTSQSHNFVASQQAGIMSESGAVAARKLLELLQSSKQETSSFLDPWAQPMVLTDENGTLSLTVEEESGKLNINKITNATAVSADYFPMAQRLLTNLKLSPYLAEAVVDWTDNADVPPHPNGAKSTYYNALKPPYDVKGDKLETLEELGLVKGVTPEVLNRLKPFVTVYEAVPFEPATKININTAPKELIAALDETMTDDMVNRILEYRKTKPIKTMADVTGDAPITSKLSTKVGYRGSVYRIRSEGKVGESIAVTEAVVRLSGSNSDILYWREY